MSKLTIFLTLTVFEILLGVVLGTMPINADMIDYGEGSLGCPNTSSFGGWLLNMIFGCNLGSFSANLIANVAGLGLFSIFPLILLFLWIYLAISLVYDAISPVRTS